ncbi:cytochrome-c peroxidase [Zhongshania arctica]|uniref:Cytochrome-c peroxidase n=1 Tax=Zhongshania arctica TaxID=3238302 RepID=A0ABV3U2C6_9GAMM
MMRGLFGPLSLWLMTCVVSMPLVAASEWTLTDVCPAGFHQRDGGCYLQSFYSGYRSLQDSGVGGLKTGLPPLREGFSAQEIDLGRLLFFDPLLSADGDMACSSCHQPAKGFSDGLPGSVGRDGFVMHRSAPTLWNVGFLRELFWDARASSLEEQLEGPLFSSVEMANTPAQLLASLRQNANYPGLFQQAFGGAGEISLEQIYAALAAFQSSLISLSSRYDLYANGFHEVLTQPEIDGMNVFRSFVARCAECHTPPAFTNQQIAVIGTPEPEGMPLDIGVEAITGDESQRGGFKVPTLRNIELTAPYMHSGRFNTLREAVAFYTGGRGHAVPEGEHLSLHWHIWEPDLNDRELDLLVAFLKTLTDQSFMPVLPQKVPSGLKPVATQILTH